MTQAGEHALHLAPGLVQVCPISLMSGRDQRAVGVNKEAWRFGDAATLKSRAGGWQTQMDEQGRGNDRERESEFRSMPVES